MALWKDPSVKDPVAKESGGSDLPAREADKPIVTAVPSSRETPAAAPAREQQRAAPKESFISPDLTIEGKIEGAGHVRIAGRFKGDVQVQGNVTIEQGSHVTGEVKADTVIIGGNLEGNVDAASRVELLSTGVLNGDLKAGSLTVAAGSRMRGRAEFGWNDNKGAVKLPGREGNT
jgi:cytoskeletal protein CcmA (bactofilin family)